MFWEMRVLPHKARRIMIATELSKLSKSLSYFKCAWFALTSPRECHTNNTWNAITTCSNWKERNSSGFAWIFDISSFRSRSIIYSAESTTPPSSLGGSFMEKPSGGIFFFLNRRKHYLFYELKTVRRPDVETPAVLGRNLSRLQSECMYSYCSCRPCHSNRSGECMWLFWKCQMLQEEILSFLQLLNNSYFPSWCAEEEHHVFAGSLTKKWWYKSF